jgi:hypothetical protein
MPNHRLLALVFLVALALRPGLASAQTPMFQLDTDEATFVNLFRLDPGSGSLTPLGSLPADQGAIAGLAAASEDLLYAVSQDGWVYAITVAPFGVQNLGNVGSNGIVGLAFADGGLYAVDEWTRSLYRIELDPLSMTLVDELRFPDGTQFPAGGGDLARTAAGDWYLWANTIQGLFRLDVGDATVTPVPEQVTGLGYVTGLAFDYLAGEALRGSSRDFDALLEIDRATGVPLGGVGFCVDCPTPFDVTYGDLASPEPAPETEPVPERPCPRANGYWQTNPSGWPVASVTLGALSYSQPALLALLELPIQGDASLNLGRQLIAAKLSVASDADPARAAASIAQADALLADFPGALPYRVSPNTATGRSMLAVAATLAAYNESVLTPYCSR